MPIVFYWPRLVRDVDERTVRMARVPFNSGKAYFVRLLARHVPARSFEQLCQHDGIQHENFELACRSRGLLRDDDEAAQVLADADRAGDSGYELRSLLVHYFMQGASVAELLDDKAFRVRLASDLPGSPSEAEQLAFLDIEDRLHFLGRSLHDFAPAFAPQHVSTEAQREKALWDVDSQRALADSSELELDTLPGTPEQSMLHVCDAGRLTSRIRPDAASTIPYREVVRRCATRSRRVSSLGSVSAPLLLSNNLPLVVSVLHEGGAWRRPTSRVRPDATLSIPDREVVRRCARRSWLLVRRHSRFQRGSIRWTRHFASRSNRNTPREQSLLRKAESKLNAKRT